MRAEYVIEEIQRVLDVCDALEKGDYETVGEKMYETHQGMSKLYEVSCDELDFHLTQGAYTLHGGPAGFHTRVWDVVDANESKIIFRYVSADGEEGFPGT